MLVDKTEFEAWMERIMGELYRMFLLCTGETTAVRQEIPNCILVFVITMTSYSCETG